MPVIDDSQNAIDMSMLQVPLEDAELYTVDDIGDPIPMLYDNEAISRSNFLPAELMEPIISTTLTQFNTESQQAGAVPSTFSMTDEEVLSILYPDFTTPLPTLSPKNHFCETSQELHQTGSCSFGPEPVAPFVPALILQRTASGLSKDLEWSMIQEYARLGHTQMPVVDIDMIFLRYRYRTPSILPDYFVLALVACGSHYSSQRLEPGIDRQAAQHLYESARKELMVAAVSEQSVDALTALFIVYFHWQGDLTAFERGRLLALSVQKLLALGLHRERDLCLGRSPRDRGVVRYLVWLIYIVDAFSGSSGPAVGDLEPAKEPFQGAEIELEQVSKNDMEAMTRDLLTGELRTGWNLMHTEFSILFNRAFATLSQLQNKIVRLQRAGQSVQHLRSELFDFETGAFSSCDLAYRTWDYERLVYVEFGGLTAAVISLNFAFWYCSLNLHFDNLRSHLAMDTSSASPSSSGPTVLGDNLNEASSYVVSYTLPGASCKSSTEIG
ncbi:protein of unknown function [Taphrina deformans PYCC 5710]|uniref:Transcription factor domain-containing protein n=1 Tax=Taphrina deformans (strain PYCC 5710 / ATCC 11124 / CBS 356.35 / IMI 108563 / JCM 9778 / NBRC 8474) TaxID=1097556 RepID=R4X6Y8_TAPDE|nr:protein of unknown function [Taphrina deformans PYCC 5710]|eukprot:CCG81002.1 protein of unknown function [Taphrina deformans PYCC 5710]